jgi:hypothetical protein
MTIFNRVINLTMRLYNSVIMVVEIAPEYLARKLL